MKTVEEALTAILETVTPCAQERVPLLEALGCVLSEEICTDTDLPPFTNSAVDGFAVCAGDTHGANRDSPVLLTVIGEVVAGQMSSQTVLPQTAMRVMTGAPFPTGADAMVMVEDTHMRDANTVEVSLPAQAGQHIRRQGEELKKGSAVLARGTSIRSSEIGILATVGCAEVPVYSAPRVAIFSTGDELVSLEQGATLLPGQIRDSNRYALASLVRETGAIVHSMTHILDDSEATENAFRACVESGAQVIVTAGGVSVGDRDFVKPVLEKLGQLEFWRIAMKPGKPLAFGHIGETLFFGLPGNPVSALVTFELFVRPTLRKMAGHTVLERVRIPVILEEPVPHIPGRREYVRAHVRWESGQAFARITGNQGSSRLSSMVGANALLIVPEESAGLECGRSAEALLL